MREGRGTQNHTTTLQEGRQLSASRKPCFALVMVSLAAESLRKYAYGYLSKVLPERANWMWVVLSHGLGIK